MMAFQQEKRAAMYVLAAVEDGKKSTADMVDLLEEADPLLVYFLFGWLRGHYHADHPAADGVLGRIVDVCKASSKVAKAARDQGRDPLAKWFEESFEYRELDREEFISLVVEKLEG